MSKDYNNEERMTICVILNQPIPLYCLPDLYKCERFIICDGGGNRLRKLIETTDGQLLAHLVKLPPGKLTLMGDGDSLNEDTKKYLWDTLGLELIRDPNQTTTDFQKVLNYLVKAEYWLKPSHLPRRIVVCGGLGGRFDHTMHVMSTIHQFQREWNDVEINVYSNCGILYYISRPCSVELPRYVDEKAYSGYWPFTGSSVVSTKGFGYDVTDYTCSIDGTFSACNRLQGMRNEVTNNLQVQFLKLSGKPIFLYIHMEEEL